MQHFARTKCASHLIYLRPAAVVRAIRFDNLRGDHPTTSVRCWSRIPPNAPGPPTQEGRSIQTSTDSNLMRTRAALLARTLLYFHAFLLVYNVVFFFCFEETLMSTAVSRAAIYSDLALTFSYATPLYDAVTNFYVVSFCVLMGSSLVAIFYSRYHVYMRWVYAVWACCYAANGIYELAVVQAPAPRCYYGALCLVFAACIFLFGVGGSLAYDRECERLWQQNRVHPEG